MRSITASLMIRSRSCYCSKSVSRADGWRCLSSNRTEKYEGYTISKKQRKALRLVNEGKPNQEAQDQTERESLLQETLIDLKESSKLQDIQIQQENPQPWHNLLVYPSRALWRSSPKPPPKYIISSQSSIIKKSERSSKQLNRTYQRIIATHKGIGERRESERRRLVNGIRDGANTSLAAKEQKGTERKSKPVFYKPEQSVCSLKFRLVPNYSITKRILAETHSLLGINTFQPKKILDVGMGAGSASAAALDYFHSNDRGVENKIDWIHGIDPSQSMRDAADLVLRGVLEGQKYEGERKRTRLTYGESIVSSNSSNDTSAGGSFDLALCAYTLNEIPSVASSLAMTAIIWEKLAPGGVAIFIEPGTPDGFNSLRSVRSMLLDCCPPKSDENEIGDETCHVIAPCTHNGDCPMVRHQRNFLKYRKEEAKKKEDEDEEDDDIDDDEDEFDEDEWDMDNDEEINLNAVSFDDKKLDSTKKKKSNFDTADASETDAFDSAFCSFVHGFGGSKHGEKFAYLVVQKRLHGDDINETAEKSNNPFHETNIVDLLKKSLSAEKLQNKKWQNEKKNTKSKEDVADYLESAVTVEDHFLDSNADLLGLELVRGNNRSSWGRLMRAPIKKKGHVIVDYCAVTKNEDGRDVGRIIRSKVTKGRSARAAPGMYSSSRKARW